MKLRELKCKNCGAKLEVPENSKKVDCEFCHSSFYVEDSYAEGYNYEKGRLNAKTEHLQENTKGIVNIISKVGKTVLVFWIIASITGLAIVGFVIYNIFSFAHDFQDKNFSDKTEINETTEDSNDENSDDEDSDDEDSVSSDFFNTFFSHSNGTNSGFFVKPTLDRVISSNKQYKDHQITVEYNGIITSNEEEIVNIKNQLGDRVNYEVTVNYDENGYVNEIIIK